MNMSGRIAVYTALMVLVCDSGLPAFDIGTGRGLGLGGTKVLSHPTASELVEVPSVGIAPGEICIELSGSRRFNMSDFDQVSAALAYRHRHLSCAMGVAQFGQRDLYSERTIRTGLAYHLGRMGIGGIFSAMLVSFGGPYDDLSAATVGGTVSYRSPRVCGVLLIDNLTSPRLDDGSPRHHPTYSAYVEVRGRGTFVVTGRLTLEETERPQFAVGSKTDVSHYGALFWGLASAPLEYGGGVEVKATPGTITYAAAYHPTLGLSHSLSLSMSIRSADGRKGRPR